MSMTLPFSEDGEKEADIIFFAGEMRFVCCSEEYGTMLVTVVPEGRGNAGELEFRLLEHTLRSTPLRSSGTAILLSDRSKTSITLSLKLVLNDAPDAAEESGFFNRRRGTSVFTVVSF